MAKCPWMDSITVTNAAQRLLDLLRAIDSTIPNACQSVAIQVGIDGGAARVYVGNSQVSSTHCGAVAVATQAPTVIAGDSNLLQLSNIYVLASVAEVQVNVTVVTR